MKQEQTLFSRHKLRVRSGRRSITTTTGRREDVQTRELHNLNWEEGEHANTRTS